MWVDFNIKGVLKAGTAQGKPAELFNGETRKWN